MFEHRNQRLISHAEWRRRVAHSALIAAVVVVVALGIGVLGYHWLGELGWLDSLLNASMILGGMGPVDHIDTSAGKLFASFYALFSGVIFIGTFGVLIAPWAHRMLHRFHAADEDDEEAPAARKTRSAAGSKSKH
jgi:ABC-type spermidine/putrescine transport system permease subunit II